MQLVFLIHDIHFGGGGERVTIELANRLFENGYNVSIVSLSPPISGNVFTINDDIEVKYLNIDFKKGSNLLNKLISIYKVRRLFSNFIGKTIILGVGNYPSLLLCFLHKSENIKTIGCQHLAYSGIKNIWAFLRRLFFHRLDTIVTLTEQDLSKFKKLNKKTIFIPNSIALLHEQHAELTYKRILVVGRMVPDKGYDLLLKVIKKIANTDPDWEFRIIGEGPLLNKFIKSLRLSGLEDKVSMLLSTNSITQEYLQASIFLMTSRTEGLPMVLLEAQSCGLPIVAFNCETGPADIVVDNQNGFLIDGFDIDNMVQKISLLCSDYNLRMKFGRHAIENVKKFSPEVIYPKWEVLFQKIMQ